MPNAKVLAEKQAMVAALAEKMKNASSGVIVDYKGITVEQDTKLRAELRKNGVDYAVVKNTLTRFAAKQIGFDELDEVLNGTTALAVSAEDSVMPAKLISEFAKKNPKVFKIKAGFVDGESYYGKRMPDELFKHELATAKDYGEYGVCRIVPSASYSIVW